MLKPLPMDVFIKESAIMLNPENKVDKERFKKLKSAQTNRGRNEGEATEVAAEEVKELRRREGRSKDDKAERTQGRPRQ